jgi:hypothetical protein
LPDGYGVAQALATTWRRLLVHSLDIANAAPLALAVPLGAWFGRRERGVQLLSLIVLLVVLGYAPFYFEGSFPGGGARFFADVLPLEHVLLARALCALGSARFAWPLAFAGFALHTSAQHRSLRDREGGRPMFEQSVLRARNVTRGLVFVSTDHGFALGHDPGQLSAFEGLVVAREHRDALDELLWEGLGRPPAYRYRYEPGLAHASASLTSWLPPASRLGAAPAAGFRVEAESLWPPDAVTGGWLEPVYVGQACASAGRGLRLHTTGGQLSFALPLPQTTQPTYVSVGALGTTAFPPKLALIWTDQATGQEQVELHWSAAGSDCWHSEPIGPINIVGGSRPVFSGTSGVLDFVLLSPSVLRERR